MVSGSNVLNQQGRVLMEFGLMPHILGFVLFLVGCDYMLKRLGG